jgi:hypothetical protein
MPLPALAVPTRSVKDIPTLFGLAKTKAPFPIGDGAFLMVYVLFF